MEDGQQCIDKKGEGKDRAMEMGCISKLLFIRHKYSLSHWQCDLAKFEAKLVDLSCHASVQTDM